MSEEPKQPWHSDLKCPQCKGWMRVRGSSVTTLFYHAHVMCGRCGIHEQLKIPIEQYEERPPADIVREGIVEPKERETVGRKLYGKRGRARSARRVRKERK